MMTNGTSNDKPRRLILGPTDDIDSTRDIIAGPWCYRGAKYRANWPEQAWEPDPFVSSAALTEAAENSFQEALALLEKLVPELNRRNGMRHNSAFWDVLLMPWLLTLVHVLYERQARVQSLLRRYQYTSLDVDVVRGPDRWSFIDSDDFFTRGIFSDEFNVWLFSELIRVNAPPAWTLHILPKSLSVLPAPDHRGPRRNLRRFLHDAIAGLRFSRVYGAGAFDRLLFSIVLRHKAPVEAAKLPTSQTRVEPFEWICNIEKIAWATLPTCFDTLPQWAPKRVSVRPGKMGVYTGLSYDEIEKYYAACRVEAGEHILSSQHGGNYGNTLVSPHHFAIEYRRGPFISWGWKTQGKYSVDAIPLPSPYLSKLRRRARISEEIILVGVFQHSYCYRLMSVPQPGQQADYVRDKLAFIDALDSRARRRLVYRPYTASPGAFDDAALVHTHVPTLPICEGVLRPRLLKANLVVLDHPGTTMNICLAAGIPLICFWNADIWAMCKEAESLFDQLRKVDILLADGTAAAQHVNLLGPNISSWWNDADTVEARQAWANVYARTGKHWRRQWLTTLLSYKPA